MSSTRKKKNKDSEAENRRHLAATLAQLELKTGLLERKDTPQNRRGLRSECAELYTKLCEGLGALGDHELALKHALRALEARRCLLSDSKSTEDELEAANAEFQVAECYSQLSLLVAGYERKALAHHLNALDLRQRSCLSSLNGLFELAHSMEAVGATYSALG